MFFVVLVRVVFTVVDAWKPEFEDRGSEEFKEFDRSFSSAIEELYAKNTNDVGNHVYAKVVQIRWVLRLTVYPVLDLKFILNFAF